jgi:hypothetical protein
MTRAKKVVLVLAGYGLSLVASGLAVALYDRRWTPADNQTMGGMIAGGEMMLGGAVFTLAALLPTGLALWYLRQSRAFWSAFTGAGLAFAVIGLAAALAVFGMTGTTGRLGLLDLVGLFGIVQMLGSPLWIGGFVLFAILAPAPDLKRRMLIAVVIEVLVAGCGALHFFSTAPSL